MYHHPLRNFNARKIVTRGVNKSRQIKCQKQCLSIPVTQKNLRVRNRKTMKLWSFPTSTPKLQNETVSRNQRLGYKSVAEDLPCMYKALVSISRIREKQSSKTKQKQIRSKQHWCLLTSSHVRGLYSGVLSFLNWNSVLEVESLGSRKNAWPFIQDNLALQTTAFPCKTKNHSCFPFLSWEFNVSSFPPKDPLHVIAGMNMNISFPIRVYFQEHWMNSLHKEVTGTNLSLPAWKLKKGMN